ncbi:MAG: energy-coupling factor transporter transmembrane protein EcfT [Malacoplasma sp.]|nr:energy-coupling factor transporter transmembrane protein EcfT [Malacoplasma sp.]
MNYSTFSSKNSIIHRMNPALKFLTTIFVVAMIFIPFGFVYQAILLVFCLSLFFLAKLPLKKLWRIIQSVIFLAIILSLINWITYKGPGVVFDFENQYYFFYKPSFLNWDSFHVTTNSDGHHFLQGSMYGGKVLPSDLNFLQGSLPKDCEYLGNGFFKVSNQENTNALKDLIGNNPVSEGWSIKEVFYGTSETQQYVYIYLTKWYTYSSQAISLMIYVTLKIFLMILIVTILTSTTSSIQLTCALEDILNPFRYLRLPVAEWSMTIALVLRFIPSLLDESNRILKAQASRGLDFKNGNLKDKLFSLTSLVVPLFSIAFKKAGELSNAMEARGYNPRYSRTRYRDYDIKFWDWIIFSIAAFLFGVLITLVTLKGKQMFVSFGFWDIFAH